MQREGGWARIAWAGGKLSTMETTGHVVRVKKQLNEEPGLNDWVKMCVDADGLGAAMAACRPESRQRSARAPPGGQRHRTSSTGAPSGTGSGGKAVQAPQQLDKVMLDTRLIVTEEFSQLVQKGKVGPVARRNAAPEFAHLVLRP
jgi:hypothetical protein